MADQATGRLSPFLRRRRLAAARPLLRGRVLDFGCGDGALAPLCDPAGYLGVDADAGALEAARRNHPAHVFSDRLPEAGAFDTVAALAVLEHIPSPESVLRRMAGLLAPGGAVVVTVPAPSMEWAHGLGARLGLFSREASQEHCTEVDRAAMGRLAREAGLRLTAARRFLLGANQLFVLEGPP